MEATATTPPRHGQTARSGVAGPTIDERTRALDLYQWLTHLLPPDWFEPTGEPIGWRCRMCDYSEAQINPSTPDSVDAFDAAWDAGCDAIHHRALTHQHAEHDDHDDHDQHIEERRRRASYTLIGV